MWSPSRVPATSPSELITTAYAHSRVFLMAALERWPNTGTFGSMTLACTDVWGTATLEGEKILKENAFSSGPGMSGGALRSWQLAGGPQRFEGRNNFNHENVLRCFF